MIENDELVSRFVETVGRKNVFVGDRATRRFRRGFRSGEGDVLCVVQPGTLLELWRILEHCVANDKIMILQAANTGLTEGSTPSGTYEREVVLINTRRMDRIVTLNNGSQVLAYPGATLFDLEKLLDPLGREPHSVIGSSCIGASIIGGVCNNSGGSLVERGPSYTELALYAQLGEDGSLKLVNHLGVDLGETPEEIFANLDAGSHLHDLPDTNLKASDSNYAEQVREISADTPARFNADKSRLYESSGCAGKLAVFAVRLDTFEKPKDQAVFYLGTNDVAVLGELRRKILSSFETLPVSAEYMERDVYDITKKYGKDTVMMIDWLDTDRLPQFFALKGSVDAWLSGVPLLANFTDRFMQLLSAVTPTVLPKRMTDYRDRFRHHLIVKTRDGGTAEAEAFFKSFFARHEGDYFRCTDREGKIAELHRFAAAGAAVRYMAVHSNEVEDIIPLDIALRRNDKDWFEDLPAEIDDQLVRKLYYGHFLCHVFHQDYIVKKGTDAKALKAKMLEILDTRGAEYPAEHNVGHLYKAKPDLVEHYCTCDPTNSFNPGIGKTSKKKHYA